MRCEFVSPLAFVTAKQCCATSAFVTDRGKYLLLQLQEGSCQENVNIYHFECLNKDQCYNFSGLGYMCFGFDVFLYLQWCWCQSLCGARDNKTFDGIFVWAVSGQYFCSTEICIHNHTHLLHLKELLFMQRGETYRPIFNVPFTSKMLLLDLHAAFDTSDQSILVERLYKWVGILGSALSWFSSYLPNNQFQVALDDFVSSSAPAPV